MVWTSRIQVSDSLLLKHRSSGFVPGESQWQGPVVENRGGDQMRDFPRSYIRGSQMKNETESDQNSGRRLVGMRRSARCTRTKRALKFT
jgi:hypothetical protein